ncbi:signal peptide peptidase-like 2B isoform X2 [Nematostella vectensis]|uniref:signal peptide peptidase-like 2B isoform X2 n=1 Tax=Nematostella vectensis TaxID=45351 RepID=UPI00207704BC|nr:signal peptide peptidase-like 2B isoform X2 [Nematostella vectensis]
MATLRCVFIIFLASSLILQISGENNEGYGVLHATTSENSADFCVMFNPNWGDPWPTELAKTPKYPTVNADPSLLCGKPKSSQEYFNKAVIGERGNCTFFEKGINALNGGALAAIIINYQNKVFMPAGNESAGEYEQLTIPVAVLAKDNGQTLKGLGKDVTVQLYQPPGQPFDANIIVLWILAVGTVAIGAYWAGISNKRIFAGQVLQHNEGEGEEDSSDGMIQVTPLMVLIFVLLICGLLLLLFYFYKYLVYVIIVLFALASCNGLFDCLMPLILWLPLGSCKIPANNLPLLKKQPEVRLIVLALFCMGMSIWWGIERNASYAWVLQDILGVSFCISLIRNIRLPSLKVCTILLVLLLIYDIFFVFITPLFSASGKSVMVEVATGGDHKEQLPMVLKIPRLTKSVLSVCARPYSLLGFGDILVPGLYIGFCHSFDTISKTPRKIYFVATTIAYGVGLLITFGALFLMKTGQPALLYLVPCVLLTGVAIALYRGELKKLWTGKMVLTARHQRLALKEAKRTQQTLLPADDGPPPASV